MREPDAIEDRAQRTDGLEAGDLFALDDIEPDIAIDQPDAVRAVAAQGQHAQHDVIGRFHDQRGVDMGLGQHFLADDRGAGGAVDADPPIAEIGRLAIAERRSLGREQHDGRLHDRRGDAEIDLALGQVGDEGAAGLAGLGRLEHSAPGLLFDRAGLAELGADSADDFGHRAGRLAVLAIGIGSEILGQEVQICGPCRQDHKPRRCGGQHQESPAHADTFPRPGATTLCLLVNAVHFRPAATAAAASQNDRSIVISRYGPSGYP